MSTNKLPPIHPGEILLEEYLKPMGISQNMIARHLGVPTQRISEIIRNNRAVTIDTALRLSKYFKTTPKFWLNLQMHYDLELAGDSKLTARIDKEVRENESLNHRGHKMGCHVDTKAAAQSVVTRKGINQFGIGEVLKEMQRLGTLSRYSISTVRTHITSRCCSNAPDNHAVTYKYFERIGRGLYKII